MKIFLSWSGEESKELANIFKEWLPNVLQYVEPYMSSNDIQFGDRWSENIKENLETAVFGLIFVTPSNINSPWINFEAGALSKTLKSRVIPILFNSDITILNNGPLKQFQSAKDTEKESVLRLLKSINASNQAGELEEGRLLKTFEMWFPTLEEEINCLKKMGEEKSDNQIEISEPSQEDFIKAIYEKLESQDRKLSEMNDNKYEKINSSDMLPLKNYNSILSNLRSAIEDIDNVLQISLNSKEEIGQLTGQQQKYLKISRAKIYKTIENFHVL